MALTKCAKCKREWQANSDVEPCPWCRASSAESSLAAMQQRAEEAEKIVELAKNIIRTGQVEPVAGMDGNVLVPTYDFAILDGALSRYDAILSSPPADASTMGGEKKQAPYIPEPWGGPEGEQKP